MTIRGRTRRGRLGRLRPTTIRARTALLVALLVAVPLTGTAVVAAVAVRARLLNQAAPATRTSTEILALGYHNYDFGIKLGPCDKPLVVHDEAGAHRSIYRFCPGTRCRLTERSSRPSRKGARCRCGRSAAPRPTGSRCLINPRSWAGYRTGCCWRRIRCSGSRIGCGRWCGRFRERSLSSPLWRARAPGTRPGGCCGRWKPSAPNSPNSARTISTGTSLYLGRTTRSADWVAP